MSVPLPPGLDIPTPGRASFLQHWSHDPGRWRARFRLLIFAVVVGVTIFGSLVIDLPGVGNVHVNVGEVSPKTVVAPRSVTYKSEVLTQEAQEQARQNVQPIYNVPESRVARRQVARAQEVADYIDMVRNDPYASREQKIAWLQAIPDLSLSEEQAQNILDLSDDAWQAVTKEAFRILSIVMRREIREGEVTKAQRAVPSMISLDLNDKQADVVQSLVDGLITANTFYNEEQTQIARDEAAQAVQPINRTIAAGETILREGDTVTDLDIEALGALGLLQPQRTWRDYLSALIIALVLDALLIAFTTLRRRDFWLETLPVLLLGVIFSGFIVTAKVMLPMHTLLPYLFPLASMAMLISSLVDMPIAVFATAILALLVGQYIGAEVEVMVYLFLGGVTGALALGKAERLNSFVRAGLWVIAVNLLILLAFRLPQLGVLDNQGMMELTFSGAVNGIFASSFTLVIYYLLGQLFGVTTSLQLLEISRPNHPLLRQLLLKAPGTYHHTLIVSNMAEEAAVAIGADSLLTRVGSYYHDIGKIIRPYFFIENNTDGENPHDRIDPYTSARIIISHVPDGVDLAKKYRLPSGIIDFIREHHGTTRVEYFYHKAVQMKNDPSEVDESAFRYAGPKPHTRETAILMLADSCEATVRAMRPQNREEMLELIHSVISRRLMSGQLDNSPLTLRDLTLISEAFVRVLQGIHHPRVKYPGEEKSGEQKESVARQSLVTPKPAG